MSYRTLGVGTDIIEVHRVAELIENHGTRFMNRWFSGAEIAYCSAKSRPELHFAARLAAKESVLKAIGSRWQHVPWLDIEIGHDDEGAPLLIIQGRMLERAQSVGITSFHVSLSHCDSFASAIVVAEGPS